jgi:hypothetical protein
MDVPEDPELFREIALWKLSKRKRILFGLPNSGLVQTQRRLLFQLMVGDFGSLLQKESECGSWPVLFFSEVSIVGIYFYPPHISSRVCKFS